LEGERDVWVLSLPGFAPEERLPATLRVAIEAQAEAIRDLAAETPVALVGYSAGGLLAHALAARLEGEGRPAAALVLLDTYPLDHPALPALTAAMLGVEEVLEEMTDARLLATGAYLRLLEESEAAPVAAPTLLVGASEPAMSLAADGPWRSDWRFPHERVEVPADHVSMMGAQAVTSAAAVEDWLAGVTRPTTAPRG
jgi:thioesterase domain-containing protein